MHWLAFVSDPRHHQPKEKPFFNLSLLDNHCSLLMDRTRSRKPTLKSQPSMAAKATRKDFKPAVEWSEDKSGHTLLVLLPGFTREDIRVQIDNAGKLLVKGSRQAPDNKVLVVDQSFDVPEDTIVDTISGRFQDGRLTLLMPRKVVEEQEAVQKAPSEEKGKEEKKEEEAVQKDAETSEERKDEATKKDEPMHEERPATTEKKQDELTQMEKPKSMKDDKDQENQKEKPTTEGEKKDDSPVLEEKSEREEEKKDEPVEKEKPESAEEKKKEEITASSAMQRVKEEKTIEKMKSKIREICADKPKEIRKKISNWRGAEGGGLDSGSFDGMLEKLNRNRKVIAVALVAFSVGFYVSHKLRTRGI